MSRTIDERVVEMRFDNKQFEAGAKETISTLTRLKEALKIQTNPKALPDIKKSTNANSISGLVTSVEQLNKRFSALGIIGMTVIQNLTNGLMGQLNKAVNVVSNSIVSGGIKRAMNIENAHYQLQALLKDESKVQAIMADAMESVDGTAYAYDEAAKAASQFAATGIQSGQEMQDALKGITGVAAMTNSSFESISMIFTTVAGNGRLMGDQLLQLASRGLNAASTISNYFKEVRGQSDMTEAKIRELVTKGQISFQDFSEAMTWAFGDSAKRANETFTGAMANMKSALARIGAGFISPLVEQNGELVQMFNALRIKINDVKSALVFDEQRSAISGLAKATGMTSDNLGKMFEKIKSNGSVTLNQLDKLNSKGADATGALTKYFNGVTDGSIRASYTVGKAVKDLTNGTEVSSKEIEKWTKKGKIDLQTFTAAMENEFGTEMTLSKQFTDFVQDFVHKITDLVTKTDMTKPMEAFYDVVGSVQNVFKGLLSVLKPVAIAFKDVFLSFKAGDVLAVTSSLEKLTSKMKLSEKGSKNLHDAFEGVFNVAKLLIDAFFGLFGSVLSISSPILDLNEGIFGLLGAFGRLLTGITKVIKSNAVLKKSFNIVNMVLSGIVEGFTTAIKSIALFGRSVFKLSGMGKLIDVLANKFRAFSNHVGQYVEGAIDVLEGLLECLFSLEKVEIHAVLNSISDALSKLASKIKKFNFDDIKDAIDDLLDKLKEIRDVPAKNFKNLESLGDNLRKALSFEDIMDRMKKVMSVFGQFFNWVKDSLGPAFEGFNVGSLLAAGGGFGMLYALIKGIDSFNKIGGSFKGVFTSLSGALNAVKDTLSAYQKEINANALIKTAGAIAILAGALVLLSFVDTKKLLGSATALSLLAGVFLYGFSKISEMSDQGNDAMTALNTVADGLNNALRSFGKSLKIKAIGGAVKSFGQTIATIAGSIIALGLMYRKDKDALNAGVDLVKSITIAMVAIMAGMTILGNFMDKGMKGFAKASIGVLSLSLALTMTISALKKLFKMEFPTDWENRLDVLKRIFIYLGALTVAFAASSRLSGGKLKAGGTMIGVSILLMTTVSALRKLFEMEIPSDGETKIQLLMDIFKAMAGLMLVIGIAGRISGGTIKAAGTILALSVFLGAVVGALMFLAFVPFQKLIKGATALGIVLGALGVALYGAGKIQSKETYKAILAMAAAVGAITASLGILSIIPFPKLLQGVIALGSILLILGNTFKQVSKIVNEKAWLTVGAMVLAIVGIATSLYVLASRPWDQLLSAATALSGTLLALAGAFNIISKSKGMDVKSVGTFLLATLALVPIGVALYALSSRPWDQMAAAGAAMSGTILAMGVAFSLISAAKPDLTAMVSFLAASVSVGLIALALNKLASNPWQNLLAAAASLSAVLLSMSAAMAICTAVGAFAGPAIAGIGLLDLFLLNMVAVLTVLGAISKLDAVKSLMSGGAQMLTMIGKSIGDFVGSIINGVLTGISSSLPQVARDLSVFMVALTPFLMGTKNIKPEAVQACKNIAAMVLALTASQFISGIAKFFGLGSTLADFGKELEEFGPHIRTFANQVKDIKPEAVKGAAAAAEIMATTARKLPAQGGWVQKVFGERSLADFGMELVKFGPRIKLFGEVVKDVKPDAVKGAASAAEIMATVATKLPPQGGLVQKIFGERNLADFGTELTDFGKEIVKFANKVKGVNPASVTGAAAAANIMAVIANRLPDSETLWSKIFGGGKYTLSEFGDELIAFGNSMSDFSSSLSGFQAETVSAAVASFKKIADLAAGLGDDSASKLITFSETLSQVGTDGVSKFVEAFSNAGSTVQSAVNTMCSNVITALGNKVPTLQSNGVRLGKSVGAGINTGLSNSKSMVAASLSGLLIIITNKVKNGLKTSTFTPYGQRVIQGIISGMNGRKGALTTVSTTICTSILNKFKNTLTLTALAPIGRNVVQGIINGMNGKKPVLLSTINSICVSMINKFKTSLPSSTFKDIGKNVVTWIINGMESKKSSMGRPIKEICDNIKDGFKNNLKKSDFKPIGANATQGLIDGLNSKAAEVEKAASRIAAAAKKAAKGKKGFDEKSPSKVFYEIGQYVSLGLAKGITDYVRVVEQASSKLAGSSIDKVRKAVDDTSFAVSSMNLNMDPVIRPVVDLSDVQKSAREINALMNQEFDLSSVYTKAAGVASMIDRASRNSKSEDKSKTSEEGSSNTFEFNQYNYSPKALTRSEIYRQTNNQFSAFRRVVATS